MKSLACHSLIFLLLLFVGCEGNVVSNAELQRIDSLLTVYETDSAWASLNDINKRQLANESDKAYYGLLRTRAIYLLGKPDASDTLIAQSVKFYEADGRESDRLAQAYFYEGYMLKTLGRREEAVRYLKQAEDLSLKIGDHETCYRVYSNLSSINSQVSEYDLALDYARKMVELSKHFENVDWLINAYNMLSVAFNGLGMADSSKIYINKTIPLLEKTKNPLTKVSTYSNIGYFNLKDNPRLSYEYSKKSYDMSPNSPALDNIAYAYSYMGNEAKADSTWQKALDMASIKTKVDIATDLMEHKRSRGDTRVAEAIALKLLVWKDSLAKLRREEKVSQLQAEFEFKQKLQEKDLFMEKLAALVAAGLLALLGVVIYARRRQRRDVVKYSSEIKKLKKDNEEKSKKSEEQNKYIKRLSENRHESIERGQRLYNALKDGETIIRWSEEDFESFFTYYFTKDTAFMTAMNADYEKLSNVMKLYLVLTKEEYA